MITALTLEFTFFTAAEAVLVKLTTAERIICDKYFLNLTMSKYAAHKYDSREDLHLVVDKNIDRQPCYQYHSLWMTRWARASSSSISLSYKNCCISDESNQKEYAKEQLFAPIKSLETRVARRSKECTNYGKSSSSSIRGCDSNLLDTIHNIHQVAETEEFEKDNCMFLDNSVMHKDVNLSSPKVSNTLSAHKLSDSAVDGENINAHLFLTSDNPNSECDHFPMFDINQKIEGILNRKRSEFATPSGRFSEPQKSLNETMSSSHVMAFSSKEYQFQAQRMTHYVDKRMEPYRSSEGLIPCQDDLEGFNSQMEVQRLKSHGQNTRSCSCSEEANISSNSQRLIEEHSLRANFTGLEHEQYNSYGPCRITISEVKSDNKVIESSSRRPWSRTNGGSIKVPRFPNSGTSRFNDAKQFHQPLRKMHYRHIDDVETQRVNYVDTLRGGSHRLSHATLHLLAEKSVSKAVTDRELLIDSKINIEVKRPALFEMLTLPVSHSRKFGDAQSLRTSKSGQVYKDGGIGIDSNIEEPQNDLSSKTDTLYIDILQATSSSAGLASSGTKEGIVFPNVIYYESAPTSPINQMRSSSEETESLDRNLQHAKSSDKSVSASRRESSISRTLSLAGDCIFKNRENSSSIVPTEAPKCLEQSSRWLKRLGHNLSDSLAIGAKRLKVGGGPSTGELLGRVINYNKSNSELMKYVKEQKGFDKMIGLPNNCTGSSEVSVKTMQSWVGRWCHRNNPKEAPKQASVATTILSDPEKLNTVPENLEGRHFPSIQAMAMMGKAMNEFRPCEFQRRGPSVVWKTEAL